MDGTTGHSLQLDASPDQSSLWWQNNFRRENCVQDGTRATASGSQSTLPNLEIGLCSTHNIIGMWLFHSIQSNADTDNRYSERAVLVLVTTPRPLLPPIREPHSPVNFAVCLLFSNYSTRRVQHSNPRAALCSPRRPTSFRPWPSNSQTIRTDRPPTPPPCRVMCWAYETQVLCTSCHAIQPGAYALTEYRDPECERPCVKPWPNGKVNMYRTRSHTPLLTPTSLNPILNSATLTRRNVHFVRE